MSLLDPSPTLCNYKFCDLRTSLRHLLVHLIVSECTCDMYQRKLSNHTNESRESYRRGYRNQLTLIRSTGSTLTLLALPFMSK